MAQTNTKKQRKPRKAETRPRDYFVEELSLLEDMTNIWIQNEV